MRPYCTQPPPETSDCPCTRNGIKMLTHLNFLKHIHPAQFIISTSMSAMSSWQRFMYVFYIPWNQGKSFYLSPYQLLSGRVNEWDRSGGKVRQRDKEDQWYTSCTDTEMFEQWQSPNISTDNWVNCSSVGWNWVSFILLSSTAPNTMYCVLFKQLLNNCWMLNEVP